MALNLKVISAVRWHMLLPSEGPSSLLPSPLSPSLPPFSLLVDPRGKLGSFPSDVAPQEADEKKMAAVGGMSAVQETGNGLYSDR